MESTCTYYMDLVWLSWAVENTTRSGKLDETEVNDKCVHKVWVRPKKYLWFRFHIVTKLIMTGLNLGLY